MKRFLCIALVLWTNGLAYGGTISALIDKTVGTTEDEFYFTVTVQGDADEEPVFPSIEHVEVRTAGTSSNFSFINGRSSKSVEYSYVLTTERPGTYVVPSIGLEIDGTIEKTAPIRFKVSAAGSAPEPGAASAPIFVKREFDKSKVYVGEQILAKVKIYSRLQMVDASNASKSSVDFSLHQTDKQRNYTEVINGETYNVIEVSQVWIPLKSGTLEIPSFALKARYMLPPDQQKPSRRQRGRSLFDDFFNDPFMGRGRGRMREKVVRSAAEKIKVLPLPKAGRPKNFSGLVGSFQLNADVTSETVKTGESISLTVTLRGRGVVDGVEGVELAFDPKIKVYPDKPVSEQVVDRDQGVIGRRVLKYALVPTQPGEYELPPAKLTVFVPKLGQYVELEAVLPKIVATGNAETVAQIGTQDREIRKAKVKVLAEDLIANHRGDRLLVAQSLTSQDRLYAGLISGIPSGALLLSLLFLGIGSRSTVESERRQRRSRAFRSLKKELEGLSEGAEGISGLLKAFKNFLGIKLDRKGEALTNKEIIELFAARPGLDEDVHQRLQSLLDQFTKWEYAGPQGAADGVLFRDLREQLLTIAKSMERVFK